VWSELVYGQFGTNAQPFGLNGVFLGMLVIVVLTMTWISKNINVMLLMMGVAVLVCFFLSLIPAGGAFLGGFLMALALIMFIVNRPAT